MLKSRRLLPFILLNVVISAATTLAVLALWDRSANPGPMDLNFTVTIQPTVPGTRPTLPPLDSPVLKIDNVIGVGDVRTEYVAIRQVSHGKVSLDGWKVQSEKGLVFQFPNLELSPGGAVHVRSAAGVDTPIELYWRQAAAVWKAGDTVRIYDSRGNLRADYKIP